VTWYGIILRRPSHIVRMPLTLRPTDLGSPIDNEQKDYGVFSREWRIGRIYENRSGPEDQRWFVMPARCKTVDEWLERYTEVEEPTSISRL
jgi:hypothetical protein